MSQLIDRFTTKQGCLVTVMDHSKPYENESIEIILECNQTVTPIKLEWDSDE